MNLYKFSYQIGNGLGGHATDSALIVANTWDAAHRYMENEYPEAIINKGELLAQSKVHVATGY